MRPRPYHAVVSVPLRLIKKEFGEEAATAGCHRADDQVAGQADGFGCGIDGGAEGRLQNDSCRGGHCLVLYAPSQRVLGFEWG